MLPVLGTEPQAVLERALRTVEHSNEVCLCLWLRMAAWLMLEGCSERCLWYRRRRWHWDASRRRCWYGILLVRLVFVLIGAVVNSLSIRSCPTNMCVESFLFRVLRTDCLVSCAQLGKSDHTALAAASTTLKRASELVPPSCETFVSQQIAYDVTWF
jgi:hypothetical protein